MRFPNKDTVERIRRDYPAGTRVELVRMDDVQAPPAVPNNILKDFFYGNINPNEKQFDRNSEYGKAAAGLADEEEKLRSMLDHETSEILDKMICLQASITGMTAEEYFIDGLRTGFRLALAILDEGKNGSLTPITDGGKRL